MVITIKERTDKLVEAVEKEFNRREGYTQSGVRFDVKVIDNVLWVTFDRDNLSKSIRIPLPHISDHGLELIVDNDITRVMCNYWLERVQTELNYHQIIEKLLCEDINVITPPPPRQVYEGEPGSIHFVPVPPVIVNPCKTAVESSPDLNETQLAESGFVGLLPLMIVEVI